MEEDKEHKLLHKPYKRFEYLYQEFLNNGFIKEKNTSTAPRNMIIALEKMKFDNFLKSNGISKPNEDGYYTGHEKYYTLHNYHKFRAKMKILDDDNLKVIKNDWETNFVRGQDIIIPKGKKKYSAKYYVLSYIFDSYVSGIILPIGRKKELERIGSEKIGKGNRFYKVFNEIIKMDLNSEDNLIKTVGNDWRAVILTLSTNPEQLEQYLQSKKI
jgi:hypothetical protein